MLSRGVTLHRSSSTVCNVGKSAKSFAPLSNDTLWLYSPLSSRSSCSIAFGPLSVLLGLSTMLPSLSVSTLNWFPKTFSIYLLYGERFTGIARLGLLSLTGLYYRLTDVSFLSLFFVVLGFAYFFSYFSYSGVLFLVVFFVLVGFFFVPLCLVRGLEISTLGT